MIRSEFYHHNAVKVNNIRKMHGLKLTKSSIHCPNIEILNFISRHVEVLFPSNREAQIAYHSLRVDVEPKSTQLQKNLSCDGCLLIV